MKTTKYAINADNGAQTNIPVTIPCRRVEIREDGNNNQGYTFTYPNGDVVDVGAGAEPLVLGNVTAQQAGRGSILGLPAQVGRAADSYGTAISMTGTATTLAVREIE